MSEGGGVGGTSERIAGRGGAGPAGLSHLDGALSAYYQLTAGVQDNAVRLEGAAAAWVARQTAGGRQVRRRSLRVVAYFSV